MTDVQPISDANLADLRSWALGDPTEVVRGRVLALDARLTAAEQERDALRAKLDRWMHWTPEHTIEEWLRHVERDGWIACSERMPEPGSAVLVSDGYQMDTAVYHITDLVFVGFEHVHPGLLTHWRPLPPPPAAIDAKAGE